MTSGSPPLSASVAARRPTARRYPRRTCPRRSTRDSRCPPPFPSSRPPCACRCFPCCRKDRAASHPRHSSRESSPQTSHAPLATSVLAANRTTSTSNSLARALRLPCFLSSICILLIYCKSEVSPPYLAESATRSDRDAEPTPSRAPILLRSGPLASCPGSYTPRSEYPDLVNTSSRCEKFHQPHLCRTHWRPDVLPLQTCSAFRSYRKCRPLTVGPS